jgi:hypothetical protein
MAFARCLLHLNCAGLHDDSFNPRLNATSRTGMCRRYRLYEQASRMSPIPFHLAAPLAQILAVCDVEL